MQPKLLTFPCSLSAAGLAASHDGSLCVSISRDRTVKVFDVVGFDMIMMMKLTYTPGTAEWVFKVR
jgi:peptidylprolyl isomerase domain and WD repeat-containing protein 1